MDEDQIMKEHYGSTQTWNKLENENKHHNLNGKEDEHTKRITRKPTQRMRPTRKNQKYEKN